MKTIREFAKYSVYIIAALVGFHLRWIAAYVGGISGYRMNGADIIVAITCIVLVWSFKGAFLPKRRRVNRRDNSR